MWFPGMMPMALVAGVAAALATLLNATPSAATIDPEIIALLQDDGATVEFIGAAPGLTGYHVTRPEEEDDPGYTLYVTDSGHAVAGILYGPDGVVLTVDQLRAAEMRARRSESLPDLTSPPPEPAPSPALAPPAPLIVTPGDFATPASPPPPTTGFTLGAGGPAVHVFADPTCSFSRATVARFAEAALRGKARLTVIPVALLGADSAYQALAAVGEDGGPAWFERRAAEPTPVSSAAVRQNNAAHAETGLDVVPVVRTFAADGTWHDHAGAVTDVAGFLEGSR